MIEIYKLHKVIADCPLLIGIYKFYENWPTGTLRKEVEDLGDVLRNGED
jgi:hypothetical protein